MNYDYNVSIILVNYNGKRYIDRLFDSLVELEHKDFTFEVVFADNASTDDSIEYLKSKRYNDKINLKIVDNGENLGFAGGNNAGVRAATGEYIVFLNNDTTVDKMWLSNLYHYMINNDYGMVNSKLLFFYDFIKLKFKTKDKIIFDKNIKINGQDYTIDNKFCKNLLCEAKTITCFGHSEISIPLLEGEVATTIEIKCSNWDCNFDYVICGETEFQIDDNGLVIIGLSKDKVMKDKYSLVQNAGSGIDKKHNGYDIGFCEEDGEKFAKPYEISNGCGAAIILKRQDFIDCGMFDEQFFMYYEDTDLSYRIRKMGKKIMYCPDAVVRHIHTGSSTEWSDFFLYHVYRNKLLFVWKNVSKYYFVKYFIFQYLDGIKNRNLAKRRGTYDALRITFGSKDVHY